MPTIANRYEPTGKAHWGGMGQVNECRDLNLDRRVMLKTVQRPSDLPRLLDEQKALLQLRSRHVVQLLDVVTFQWNGDDIHCLVLEYIDGDGLDAWKYSSESEYRLILWQIAAGLADIHAAKVIHRDIKPENIRLDANGIVKIIDFGLSRQTGIDDKTRSIIGTAPYMAPELFGSSTIALSPAVDVFAFGCTALSLAGVQLNGITNPPTTATVAAAATSISSDMHQLIAACMNKNANKRPDMRDVADELSRALLKDQHRARIIESSGKAHELNSKNTQIKIKSTAGELHVDYDGYEFKISYSTGSAYVNNTSVGVGHSMAKSCLITLGDTGKSRAFLTFDVSNPEVTA